jgi:hypothetical protein
MRTAEIPNSRYLFGRTGAIFIKGTAVGDRLGVRPLDHTNWRGGGRIGSLAEDRMTGFIRPFEREHRVYRGTVGGGIAVGADANVCADEQPNSLGQSRRVPEILGETVRRAAVARDRSVSTRRRKQRVSAL